MKRRGWWLLDALAHHVDQSAQGVAAVRAITWALLLACAGCEPTTHGVARIEQEAGFGFDASGWSEESVRSSSDSAYAPMDAAALADAELAADVRATERALPWLRSEVALEPDGRSAPLSFALAGLARPVFALRTYAADAAMSDALCFQLEEVRADASGWWVPRATSADYGDYCTSCEQRVAVGSGYGLFVLPSSAEQPESVTTLELRIALRDCLTLSPLSPDEARPLSLVVESASFSAPPRTTGLVLPLSIAVATPDAFSGGAELDSVFVRVREIWRAAGIELSLRGPLTLPRPVAPVVYDAIDRQALSALAHAVKTLAREAGVESAAPWLVLTPCLVRQDALGQGLTQPLATTAHLPGGFAVADEPDGIFVAAERCGGLTPSARYTDSDSLAAVMAHELGHYLGLFHVVESDGREDSLADTHADEPNLMQAFVSAGATKLTESQIDIARRHPALAVTNVAESQLVSR